MHVYMHVSVCLSVSVHVCVAMRVVRMFAWMDNSLIAGSKCHYNLASFSNIILSLLILIFAE